MSDRQKATFLQLGRVVIKAALLFVVLNILWAWAAPLPTIARWTVYNAIVPGRPRLPFGENPAEAYNFSTYQLDAMFASHEIADSVAENEYRVMLIGDSSVWGFLLQPEDTLAGQLNALRLIAADGRRVRIYNLGYPTISLTKDLLLLDRALDYDPDLIVWLTTLEAMPQVRQTSSPIVQHHPAEIGRFAQRYNLAIDLNNPAFVYPTRWDQTIVGQRREIADVLRLNLYGFMWAATSIDQVYPPNYEPRAEDLEADESFYNLSEPLVVEDLALDVLEAGIAEADVPVLIVNEPMFISMGENSDIRYNFFYPRWAYDAYRQVLATEAAKRGWHYADLWDVVARSEFTNSAIHLTPEGERQLAQALAPYLDPFLQEP
jgi:hypothetical protein